MIHLLGIKSNTDFPKEVELHNNDPDNYGIRTRQKSFMQNITISQQINANVEILKPKVDSELKCLILQTIETSQKSVKRHPVINTSSDQKRSCRQGTCVMHYRNLKGQIKWE